MERDAESDPDLEDILKTFPMEVVFEDEGWHGTENRQRYLVAQTMGGDASRGIKFGYEITPTGFGPSILKYDYADAQDPERKLVPVDVFRNGSSYVWREREITLWFPTSD